MLRSRVYDLIRNGSHEEIRKLARRLAEHVEQFGPYGLKEFEPPFSNVQIQFRPKCEVEELVKDLKDLIPYVTQWYMPGHVTSMAFLKPYATREITLMIAHCYGAVTHEYELIRLDEMVVLILKIAGMRNVPCGIVINGKKTSKRAWRLAKGVETDETMLYNEFTEAMGE